MDIAFYISNHGFGHATRMAALINEYTKIGIYCHVMTNRPYYLFNDCDQRFLILRDIILDFGIIQQNWLEPNISATEASLESIINNNQGIIENEIDYCHRNNITIIIADIPFSSFEIAARANIFSVAVSNFDWHYIYEKMQISSSILSKIKESYNKANLALRLPFSDESSMSAFSNTVRTGLLVRYKQDKRKEITINLNIDPQMLIVLIAFSNSEDLPLSIEQLLQNESICVLSTQKYIHPRHREISPDKDFSQLIASVDVIITKTGYSTLAEAVANNKLIIYTDRESFPEDDILLKKMTTYKRGIFVPHKQLKNFQWNNLKEIHRNLPDTKPERNCNNEVAQLILKSYFKNRGKNYAVLDIGTNNILLLWACLENDSFKVIHRASSVSALGKKMKQGKIHHEAIKRAKAILKDYLNLSRSFTENITLIGTSCCRDATNISLLKGWLKNKYNLDLRVISGEEEAYLNGLANLDLAGKDDSLIFDIGGGSTEFTFIKKQEILKTQTIDVGLRRLENLNDISSEEKVVFIEKQLGKLESIPENTKMIGVGGTASTIACLAKGITKYDSNLVNGTLVSYHQLETITSLLKSKNNEQISELIPFEPARGDLLLSGIEYTKQILDHFNMKSFIVSDKGLQFGYIQQIHTSEKRRHNVTDS